MIASIYSVYMDNIDKEVLLHQDKCVRKFLPSNCTFTQVYEKQLGVMQDLSIARCTANSPTDITMVLDIDCIPLSHGAFEHLISRAQDGILAGCIQRASHIQNNKHVYVGPFCMAFSRDKYKAMGSPTFGNSPRGDIAEELTYAWQAHSAPIYFLRPTHVDVPLWPLDDGEIDFGYGTTYADLFYHEFCSRETMDRQRSFIRKCQQVLRG